MKIESLIKFGRKIHNAAFANDIPRINTNFKDRELHYQNKNTLSGELIKELFNKAPFQSAAPCVVLYGERHSGKTQLLLNFYYTNTDYKKKYWIENDIYNGFKKIAVEHDIKIQKLNNGKLVIAVKDLLKKTENYLLIFNNIQNKGWQRLLPTEGNIHILIASHGNGWSSEYINIFVPTYFPQNPLVIKNDKDLKIVCLDFLKVLNNQNDIITSTQVNMAELIIDNVFSHPFTKKYKNLYKQVLTISNQLITHFLTQVGDKTKVIYYLDKGIYIAKLVKNETLANYFQVVALSSEIYPDAEKAKKAIINLALIKANLSIKRRHNAYNAENIVINMLISSIQFIQDTYHIIYGDNKQDNEKRVELLNTDLKKYQHKKLSNKDVLALFYIIYSNTLVGINFILNKQDRITEGLEHLRKALTVAGDYNIKSLLPTIETMLQFGLYIKDKNKANIDNFQELILKNFPGLAQIWVNEYKNVIKETNESIEGSSITVSSSVNTIPSITDRIFTDITLNSEPLSYINQYNTMPTFKENITMPIQESLAKLLTLNDLFHTNELSDKQKLELGKALKEAGFYLEAEMWLLKAVFSPQTEKEAAGLIGDMYANNNVYIKYDNVTSEYSNLKRAIRFYLKAGDNEKIESLKSCNEYQKAKKEAEDSIANWPPITEHYLSLSLCCMNYWSGENKNSLYPFHALFWSLQAAKNNNATAAFNVGITIKNMLPLPENEKNTLALKFYRIAEDILDNYEDDNKDTKKLKNEINTEKDVIKKENKVLYTSIGRMGYEIIEKEELPENFRARYYYIAEQLDKNGRSKKAYWWYERAALTGDPAASEKLSLYYNDANKELAQFFQMKAVKDALLLAGSINIDNMTDDDKNEVIYYYTLALKNIQEKKLRIQIIKKLVELEKPNAEGRELLEYLLEKQLTWFDIIAIYVKQANSNEQSAKMDELIVHRDVLDHEIYKRDIVENLFRNDYFTVDSKPERKGELSFYKITILNGANRGPREAGLTEKVCTISVIAPGSRDKTSDIDTTIMVEGTEHLTQGHLPAILIEKIKKYPDADINGLLETIIIDKFYSISEERQHMTSSLSRDSNVYVSGFLRKLIKQSKESKEPLQYAYYQGFNEVYDFNPVTDKHKNSKLFSVSEVKEFYKLNKEKKHLLEYAASLVSIYSCINEQDMKAFESAVEKYINEQILIPDSNKKAKKDIESIFSQAKIFAEYRKKELSTKMCYIKEKTDYISRSSLRGDAAKLEKDIEIAALNRLYVDHLWAVNTCYGAIEKITNKIDNIILQINALNDALENPPLGVNNDQITNAKEQVLTLKNDLRDLLRSKANKMNELQEAVIKSLLFANEAHTNRSASYHVVDGGILKFDCYSIQTVVCSILQQVGFYLQHPQEQLKFGMEQGEVACKNAKYPQRIFELFFNGRKAAFDQKEINEIASIKNKTPVLNFMSGAKSSEKEKKNNYDRLFSWGDYVSLNTQCKIVSIKKSSDPYLMKIEKAQNELKELFGKVQEPFDSSEVKESYGSLREKHRYLLIAAKTIVAGYIAKLDKTHSDDKEYLWGEGFTKSLRQ